MDTLTVAYEGTVGVQVTTIINLNRRYEHFFAQQGESLTQTFNRFNCLVNYNTHKIQANLKLFKAFKTNSYYNLFSN